MSLSSMTWFISCNIEKTTWDVLLVLLLIGLATDGEEGGERWLLFVDCFVKCSKIGMTCYNIEGERKRLEKDKRDRR